MTRPKPKPAPVPQQKAIRVLPGDLIVITYPSLMTQESIAHAVEAARQSFPENRVIVLGSGAKLDVFRVASPTDPGASLRMNLLPEIAP